MPASTPSSPAAGAAPTTDTVDAAVKINGTPVSGPIAASILDVTVQQQLGQPAHATLRLAAWDFDAQQLMCVDDETFEPGNAVEIELGYVDQRGPVFSGEIVNLDLEASASEPPTLTVQAYDLLHRLGRGQRQRPPYRNSTYTTIVRAVAQDYGFAVDAKDDEHADPKNPLICQKHESDLTFLSRLAAKIHYELSAASTGKTLVFRESRLRTQPSLTLDASLDLVKFSASIDASGQFAGVDIKGINNTTKQKIEVSVENKFSRDRKYGSPDSRRVISNVVVDTVEGATVLANAELSKMQSEYLHVNGACFGRSDLRPGMSIAITGVGARFSGSYYITAATHTLTPGGGYRTSFVLEGESR